mgnify:CR=1 FL=1
MDIDLDFPDRNKLLELLPHRVAKLTNGKPHNTGVYFTEIPNNPLTNVSNIDYKTAESLGFFKIDCLNVSIYQGIKDNDHLQQLLEREPVWELLEHKEFVDQVFHVNGHSNTLALMKPRNVTQLAAVLAMIRPAKRYLIGKDWDTVMKEIWTKPDTGEYYFKKSHSFSYAFAVIVHMNLICESYSS